MSAPVAPENGTPAPESTGLAAASAAARQNLQTTGTVTGEPAAEQPPRDPNGRFTQMEQAAIDAGAAKPGEGANVTPPAAAPPEGDAPPEGEAPEAPAGDEPASEHTVELPPRRVGEPPLVLDAGDAETAEALRRLANQAMAGEEVRSLKAAVEQEQQGLAQTQEYIETDPVGFVLDHLPANMQDEIALQLLASPEVFARVSAALEKMLDPEARDLMVARLENRRLTMRDSLRAQREERVGATKNAQEIRDVVVGLLPETWSPEQQGQAFRDMMTDLQRYADMHGVKRIDPSHIPALLAGRMAGMGLDPVERAAAAAKRQLRGANGTPAVPGASARPASPPAPPGPKKVTATTFVEGQERRRRVAAVAPAGAGVPPATLPSPPAGATLKEATEFLRKQRAGA